MARNYVGQFHYFSDVSQTTAKKKYMSGAVLQIRKHVHTKGLSGHWHEYC